jgi:dipeptidase E
MRPRQILALGGGGFSMETSPALDDAVLAAAGVDDPRVLFVPTASGDAADYIARFYRAFARKARASHLELFRRGGEDLTALLGEQDIVYVGGGNTAAMLAVWRLHAFADALRVAYERGVVMAGVSAGAVCWFEGTVTDSFGPLRPLHDGVGLMKGWMVPHYDGEAERRPALEQALARGDCPGAWAADDGAALWFRDDALHGVVASRPHARAYRVERSGTTTLETRVLT